MLNAANLQFPSGYLEGQQDSLRISEAPRTLARLQALGMAGASSMGGSVMMRTQAPTKSFYGADAVGMTPTPYGLAIHDGYGAPVQIPPGAGPYPITSTPIEPAFNATALASPVVIIEVLRGLSDGLSSSAIAVKLIDQGLDDTAVGRALRAVYTASRESGLSPQDLLRMSVENRPPQSLVNAIESLGGVEWFRRFDQKLTAVPVSAVPTPSAIGEISTTPPDGVQVAEPPQSSVLVEQVVVPFSPPPADSALAEDGEEEVVKSPRRRVGLLPIVAAIGAYLLLQQD